MIALFVLVVFNSEGAEIFESRHLTKMQAELQGRIRTVRTPNTFQVFARSER